MNELEARGGTAPLKRRIMRRVYAIWFWRSVAPMLAVEGVLIAAVAVGVLTQISPRAILLNALEASTDAWAFVMFFVDNFFVKSMQSRLLVLVYGVLLGFFVRDIRAALVRRREAFRSEFAALLSAVGNRR